MDESGWGELMGEVDALIEKQLEDEMTAASRTIDNRNHEEMNAFLESRIEALTGANKRKDLAIQNLVAEVFKLTNRLRRKK